MQKLITVRVDTEYLVKDQANPFTINEVESVNELLELGWEIEQLEILKGGSGNGDIIFLALLNDDPMMDSFDDEYDEEFEEDDNEDNDDDDDDVDAINEIRPMKKV